MKILYLYQYFVARQGHGMTRAYEFARRLIQMGHEVHVVTSPGYLPDEYNHFDKVTRIDIEGVPVIIIPIPYSQSMSFPRRIRSFIQFALLASWVCMRQKADVVYASSGPLTIAIPGIAASLWQRIPMVFEVRDLWPEIPIAVGALKNPAARWLARALEWIAYHWARHVVALSPGMAAGVQRRGIAPERVTVIPNSSDVDLFDVPRATGQPIRDELNLKDDQPLVVYTGTFGLLNNVGYLVDVARVMQQLDPSIHFLLVGSGAEFENVVEKARQQEVLGKNLTIWSPRSKTEMPAILSAATITTSLFLPIKAMWNNSANKFFDSLAAGRPIMLNYGGWQADLLRETGAGISVSPEDTRQAAADLAAFLQDHPRIEAAGAAARELAYTRFHRDEMAKKLESVLRKVTQK